MNSLSHISRFLFAALLIAVFVLPAFTADLTKALPDPGGSSGKYPEFKGNVATVCSKPLCRGDASTGHCGGNAETYMYIAEAMGQAMVELIKTYSGASGPKASARSLRRTFTSESPKCSGKQVVIPGEAK